MRKFKILIVDDNPINVDLLKEYLKGDEFLTISAYSGKEAVKLFREENPDLMILDIMMPEFDGFDVLNELSAERTLNYTPIIVLTALQNIGSIVQSLEMGADDFLSKPFSNIELLARVKSLLRTKTLNDRIKQYAIEVAENNEKLNDLLNWQKDMVNMIIHDLSNSIGTLQIAFHILEQKSEKSIETAPVIESIKSEIESISNLVVSMLDMSKIEAGKFPINLVDINVLELFNSIISKNKLLFKNKNIQLVFNHSNLKNTKIKADDSLITRILTNLLINALKYSDENSKVEINLYNENGYFVFEVSDEGRGIPDEHLDRIFDKYYQVSAMKEGTRRGIGLGLTFCKLAVEAHNGSITAKKNDISGVRFIIKLPVS